MILAAALAIVAEVNFAYSFWSETDALATGLVAEGARSFAPKEFGRGMVFNASGDELVVVERVGDRVDELPSSALTISAWVAVESTQRWGGIVSCVADDGDYEKGWILGFDQTHFTFGLATTGNDDGNGSLEYLRSETPVRLGRWHHVTATFDGSRAKLYVNGKLEAESGKLSGEVLYDLETSLVLGAYKDSNELHPLDGRLGMVQVDSTAWGERPIALQCHGGDGYRELSPWTDLEFEFLVEPYLTWPRLDGVSLLFETTFPSSVRYSLRDERTALEDAEWGIVELVPDETLHELAFRHLEPSTKYFYTVEAMNQSGEKVEFSSAFRTASRSDDAYTFCVIGDTQTNGEVAKRVSDLAAMHRPNFVVHCGDLVDAGSNKRDWTHTFFPSMQPLLSRSPMISVLGNHEQDAEHYYRYMSLPDPERWYSCTYGNAEFFMLDGNRSLADQSAQLKWLQGALKESKATWKFAVLHQPPYTSDSNDYGDTLVTTSHRGDPNVRNIVRTLEREGVDLCFSGHVHDYERTFPIKGGKVVPYAEGGVLYVTAAGGGGPLEDFDPVNTWFGHKKARYHHVVYVAIHGRTLEFQAIDENGRLFDVFTIEKR